MKKWEIKITNSKSYTSHRGLHRSWTKKTIPHRAQECEFTATTQRPRSPARGQHPPGRPGPPRRSTKTAGLSCRWEAPGRVRQKFWGREISRTCLVLSSYLATRRGERVDPRSSSRVLEGMKMEGWGRTQNNTPHYTLHYPARSRL